MAKSFNTANTALLAAADAFKNVQSRQPQPAPRAALPAAPVAPVPEPLAVPVIPVVQPVQEALPVAQVAPTPAPVQVSAKKPARKPVHSGHYPTKQRIVTAGGRVQFNVLLLAEARERLRHAAVLWGCSERDIVEHFAMTALPTIQLPTGTPPPPWQR